MTCDRSYYRGLTWQLNKANVLKYAMQSVDTQLVTTHKHYVSRRFSRIKTCQLNKTAQQNKISPPEYRWPTKIKITHQYIYIQHTRKKIAHQNKITHQHIKSTTIKIAHQNIDNPLDFASSWFSTLANICITTWATVKPYLAIETLQIHLTCKLNRHCTMSSIL